MRRKKLAIGLLSLMMATGVAGGATSNVQAAKKKLSVNRVYENAARIKGKTKKKYTVKVKIGKKTYKAKANKKGNFSIKVPKVAGGKKYTVKAYKGKKYYTKKTVYVIAKKVKINTYKPTSKSISGYTRPSYKVKVTINGKTYTAKASKTSGKFTVKLKKAAGAGKAVVKVYNTKGKAFTSATKTHTHQWEKQYKTVHHDAVGHWETVTVPAWNETKRETHFFCYGCGKDLDVEYQKYKENWDERHQLYPEEEYCEDINEFATYHRYILNSDCVSSWYTDSVYVNVYHPASTKKEWKIDKKSWDEKVANGYRCDCGAKK